MVSIGSWSFMKFKSIKYQYVYQIVFYNFNPSDIVSILKILNRPALSFRLFYHPYMPVKLLTIGSHA